jgi:hypothetical protein
MRQGCEVITQAIELLRTDGWCQEPDCDGTRRGGVLGCSAATKASSDTLECRTTPPAAARGRRS